MPGLETNGRPFLATQEMLQTLTAGSELPDGIISLLDQDSNFYVETAKDVTVDGETRRVSPPINNHGNTKGAQLFREFPGIEQQFEKVPGYKDLMKTPDGMRRLMMAAMALTMRSRGQDPIIGTDNEGMLELFDSMGFETWDSSQVESSLQKKMEIDPVTGKPKFDQQQFDHESQTASRVDEQRNKTQQLRKAQLQGLTPPEPSVSEPAPEEPSSTPPRRTVSMDGP